ncbi:hypothetical protein PU560_14480 [Georgenia sp. 10Sc9-8]|uniref:Cell division protein FtsL n=1 Tax=Georgenia halotolerans TaxID=3028317 RepID=A0ABT5U050_9MICO|nr:hypothetical protein [Georgenia halotolerans]
MSALTAARRAPNPRRDWRPRLEVVRSPEPARSVVPYLLLCAAILAGALIGALLLNTQMAVAAYEIHDQQIALNRLEESEASLREQVEVAGSPARLQEQAEEMGMVEAEELRFIDLTAGEVVDTSEEEQE